MGKEWISYHVFYFDQQLQEQLLVNCIVPLMNNMKIKKSITKWFFIRYWEGGPHIRLRILGDNNIKKVIRRTIQSYINNAPSYSNLDSIAYYNNHTFDGVKIDIDKLPWFTNNSIVEIDYIKELERYGGIEAIVFCENIFMHSSEVGAKIIEYTYENVSLRISIAIDLILVILHISHTDFKSFFYHYQKLWNAFFNDEPPDKNYIKRLGVQNRINELDARIKNNVIVNRWYYLIKDDVLAIEKIWEHDRVKFYGILMSLIHMFNNRLGIVPYLERQIAKTVLEELMREGGTDAVAYK